MECDDELISFDDLRFNIKEAKSNKMGMKSNVTLRYKKLAASLGKKVLIKQAQLDEELQKIERAHFQDHNRLPNKDTNPRYSGLLKDRNVATAILRNLNIHF